MVSQINPDLLPLTSGPKKGQVPTNELRLQLGHARDESNAHESAIELLQQANHNINQELSQKLSSDEAANFASSDQGEKADQAILYDEESGMAKLPNGDLVSIGGTLPPVIQSIGNGSVTFED